MTAERWAQLQSLFGAAMSLSDADREAAVQRLQAEDSELAADLVRLLNNYAQGSSYLETPVGNLGLHLLKGGDLLADRFEIVRFLGAGGMGQVYRAEDRELGEPVAIKVLAEHLVMNPQMLEWFRQEVQVSRRVSHPNVCRMFDLGKTWVRNREFYFLSMELIEGESLAGRLAQGPLPVDEAKSVLLEILDGLEAAHDSGVLHRDLKPANIMLRARPTVNGRRVAVMDFGLARQLPTEPAGKMLTEPVLIGTPLFMAPEQIEGAAANQRSDLYAFGLVAREVLVGTVPANSSNPLAAIIKRARSKPESLRESVPGLGLRWDAALLSCLEPDPARRPGSVRELRSLLKPQKFGLDVTFRPAFTRRRLVTAGFTLATVAAGTGIWSSYRPTAAIAEGKRVMLAPSENLTHESVLDSFGLALRGQLAQSRHFSIVEPGEFPEVLSMMLKKSGDRLSPAEVRHLALRLDIPLVLYSTMSRVGSTYSLQLLVERVTPGSLLAALSWNRSFQAGNTREIFGAMHDGCLWLRQLVGEPAAAIDLTSKRPDEVTTDSWEALQDYTQGETAARSGDRKQALVWFSSAVRRDPLFVMAQMRQGDIYINLGEEANGLRAWGEAMQAMSRRPCSRREELAIRGMYATDTGDLENAVKRYEELLQLYPQDERGLQFRIYPLCALNRRTEAVEVAGKYVRLRPDRWSSWFQLALASIFAGDDASAAEALAKLDILRPGPQSHAMRFQYLFQRSQYDHAAAELEQATDAASRVGDKDRVSEYARRLAHLLAERGKIRSAVEVLEKGASDDEKNGLRSAAAQKLVSRAYLSLSSVRPESIREWCGKALELDFSVERLRRCGQLLSRAGQVKQAGHVLAALLRFPRTTFSLAAAALVRGELAAAGHDFRKAASDFDVADRLLPPAWAKEHRWALAEKVGAAEQLTEACNQIISCKGMAWILTELDWPGTYARAVTVLSNTSQSMAAERGLLIVE